LEEIKEECRSDVQERSPVASARQWVHLIAEARNTSEKGVTNVEI
jgi:hypothetical protein